MIKPASYKLKSITYIPNLIIEYKTKDGKRKSKNAIGLGVFEDGTASVLDLDPESGVVFDASDCVDFERAFINTGKCFDKYEEYLYREEQSK